MMIQKCLRTPQALQCSSDVQIHMLDNSDGKAKACMSYVRKGFKCSRQPVCMSLPSSDNNKLLAIECSEASNQDAVSQLWWFQTRAWCSLLCVLADPSAYHEHLDGTEVHIKNYQQDHNSDNEMQGLDIYHGCCPHLTQPSDRMMPDSNKCHMS